MVKLVSKLLAKSHGLPLTLKLKIKYKIDLSFKSFAQVMYNDDRNNNRIDRFYSNCWEREIFISIEEILPLKLKTFINTSNLYNEGVVHMSIHVDDKIVSDKTFTIEKKEFEYTGWLELIYSG